MARHIEMERLSINRLDQTMNTDLIPYETDRKHKFVSLVFKKLREKIEDSLKRESKDENLPSTSNNNTTEENTSEDDDIDYSDNNLDSSGNISDE